jgi:hypothetical protein
MRSTHQSPPIQSTSTVSTSTMSIPTMLVLPLHSIHSINFIIAFSISPFPNNFPHFPTAGATLDHDLVNPTIPDPTIPDPTIPDSTIPDPYIQDSPKYLPSESWMCNLVYLVQSWILTSVSSCIFSLDLIQLVTPDTTCYLPTKRYSPKYAGHQPLKYFT